MEGGGAGDVMCDVNRLFIGHTGDAGTYRWRLLASTTRALTSQSSDRSFGPAINGIKRAKIRQTHNLNHLATMDDNDDTLRSKLQTLQLKKLTYQSLGTIAVAQ